MYSIAIERQLEMLRWLDSPEGHEVCRPDSQYVVHDNTTDGVALAESFRDFTVAALDMGETYYWKPEICDFVFETSKTMPRWTLHKDALPSKYGFYWLGKPMKIQLSTDHNYERDVVAFSWSQAEHTEFVPALGIPAIREGVIVTLYRSHNLKDEMKIDWAPYGSLFWAYGNSTERVCDPDWYRRDEFAPENRSFIPPLLPFFKFFAAACSFIEQKILVQSPEKVDRPTRRRLGKEWRPEPLVRVVELRKQEVRNYQERGEAGEPVEWSCRWLVQGHWRNQWYPSRNEHAPAWIGPYVKGPEDKPLKPPKARVYAVVR